MGVGVSFTLVCLWGVRECVCLFPSVSVLGVRWFVCEGVVCVCVRVCGKSPAVTYVLLLGSRR